MRSRVIADCVETKFKRRETDMNLLTFLLAVAITTVLGAGCWKLVELLVRVAAWGLGVGRTG